MEIYQLRAFATAARLGNLTRTAEALHLTQPAITAQIKALEEELGVALFERRPGGITLTRAGELLLQDAEQILTTAGHLQGRARELQGEVTGQLVLGTLGDPESLRLGTLLGVLSEKLPLLEIKTRQGAAEDVREQVAAGLLRGGFYIGMQLPGEVGGLVLQTIHYRIVAPWRDRERVLHAGWRGLAADIPGRALARLQGEFGIMPGEMAAVIGVGVGPCHYPVGPDVIAGLEQWPVDDPGWEADGRVDLARFAAGRLRRLGVAPDAVRVLPGCTACDARWHSYRRDGERAGRQWCALVLTPEVGGAGSAAGP